MEGLIHLNDVAGVFQWLTKCMQIKLNALSVFLVFAVTLSLFPSVLSTLKSSVPHPSGSGWTSEIVHTHYYAIVTYLFADQYFVPLVCFFLFNTSDFVGRYITQWINVSDYIIAECYGIDSPLM